LNVNGIFKLAYPPDESCSEPDQEVSPFELLSTKGATSTEKGATTTRKGETTTEKGAGVAPEQSIYPNSETTTTTTAADESRGCGNSSKPAAKRSDIAEEDSLPVNERETRDAVAYLSKRFVEETGRTLKLTKEHKKTLGTLVRDYDLEIVRGVWNEYLRRAPWNADTDWHAAIFLRDFDSYFKHAQESAAKALRPFIDKDGKLKTDAKPSTEAKWALSLNKKRRVHHVCVPKEKPESYDPRRTSAEQAAVESYRSWRMPEGTPADDFLYQQTPIRNYRTICAIVDREHAAHREWAEEQMRQEIAQYLATPNPSDDLVRSAAQAVSYFHFPDKRSGLTDDQRQEVAERSDRLPTIPEEEDEDGNEV